MKVKVYTGYYELFVTDKEMPRPYVLLEEFDNVPDAEYFVEEADDWMWLDRGLIPQSTYCWDNEDYDSHTFDMKEMLSAVWS